MGDYDFDGDGKPIEWVYSGKLPKNLEALSISGDPIILTEEMKEEILELLREHNTVTSAKLAQLYEDMLTKLYKTTKP